TYLREAETLAERLADQRRLGRVCRRIATILRNMQAHEQALAYGQRAHAIATALGDVDLQMRVDLVMGQVYFDLGDYRQAMEHFQQMLTAPQGAPLEQSFGDLDDAHIWIMQCLRELGRFADGAAYGDKALQIAEAVDRPLYCLRVYSRVGAHRLRQ